MSFNKFEARCKTNWKSAYAMNSWHLLEHYKRYKLYIQKANPKLICQACGGAGGEEEPVLDTGEGPWLDCGWCEGTGYVTRWTRGAWLKYRKGVKAEEQPVSLSVRLLQSRAQ